MKVSGYFCGPIRGRSYGIRISRKDRDRYFQKTWPTVIIELDTGETFEANLTPSFWRSCIELRNRKIARWLIKQGLAPWPKGEPPRLNLEPIGHRRFRLS